MCYLFKKSSELEEEKIPSEIVQKLEEIEEKLKKEKEEKDHDINKLKKQILWLNISNKNDVYNLYSVNNDILLFESSKRIISFLKYLFGIKPELQFRNLYKKFRIVIEIKNDKLYFQDNEFNEIQFIINWLIYVWCKIPVMVYCQLNIEKTIKMKLHSYYSNLRFTTEQSEVAKFIKNNATANILCHNEKFSIVTTNNETTARNNNSLLNLHSVNEKKKSTGNNHSFDIDIFK